jgi:hypothetical protein
LKWTRIEGFEALKVLKESGKLKGIGMECREKRGKEREKEKERAHGGNEGNVETREEEHGNEGGANTQERAMAVGKIAEPVIDGDRSDPLISRDQGSSENLLNETRRDCRYESTVY